MVGYWRCVLGPFKMSEISIFLVFSGLICFLYTCGLHHLLTATGDSPCEMTYMFEYPQYVKIGLSDDVTRIYNRYGLYAYGEGQHTNALRKMRFSGIPILFIPGNAGSYKQARSLASVCLRKALNARLPYHMDFFSVDLNEEYSGLYGGVLDAQTKFVRHAIWRILELYQNNKGIQPRSVVVIGHSMGGMIAKGLFNDPSFDPELVQAIITLATPHYEPVVTFDEYLYYYYQNTSNTWKQLKKNDQLSNITIASIGGGDKDKLVRSGLISSWEIDMHTVTTTIPTVWRAVDHLCIVWCKELVLVLSRALFDMVDQKTRQITTDSSLRRAVLTYHLLKRDSGKHYATSTHPQFVTFHEGAEWIEPLTRQLVVSANLDPHGRDHLTKPKHVMIRLVDNPRHALLAVEAINQEARDWVFACNANHIVGDYRTCLSGENLSNSTMLWPALRHKRKRVVLDLLRLHSKNKFSHVVLRMPLTNEPIQLNIDVHSERILQAPEMSLLSLFDPRPVTLVHKTEDRAVRYEVEFRDVQSAWHAELLIVKPLSCSKPKHHAVSMLVVPWSNERSFAYITETRQDALQVKLLHFKWQILPEVSQRRDPRLIVKAELMLDPVCSYSISVEPAPRLVFSQLVRIYTPSVLAYIVAILMLVLREQLHSLRQSGACSLFHVALNRGAKPYFVLPLAKILSKLLSLEWEDNPLLPYLKALGLPEPSLNVLAKPAWEQLTIPFVLYAFAFGVVYIAGFACMFSVVFCAKIVNKTALSMIGRVVHGSIVAWTASVSDFILEILLRMPPILVCLLLTLGSQTCGALPLTIGAIYFFLQICKMYEDYLEALLQYSMRVVTGKQKISLQGLADPDSVRNVQTGGQDQKAADGNTEKKIEELRAEVEAEEKEESRRSLSDINVHVTVFLLYVTSVLPCIPSLLVWAHNYKFSMKLDLDPVFHSSVFIMISSASCFWLQSFPNRKLRFYGVIADALFSTAVLTMVYAPSKMAVIPPIIAVTMSLIAIHQWIATPISIMNDISDSHSDLEAISSNEGESDDGDSGNSENYDDEDDIEDDVDDEDCDLSDNGAGVGKGNVEAGEGANVTERVGSGEAVFEVQEKRN